MSDSKETSASSDHVPVASFSEHLMELRKGLIRSLLACLVGWIIAYWKSADFFKVLIHPVQQAYAYFPQFSSQHVFLQTLEPIEVFMINLRLIFLVGILLASPVWIREIWVFASPGLKSHERGVVFWIFTAGMFFFLLGASGAYFFIIPVALRFLIQYNIGYHLLPRWSLGKYFDFLISFLLAFGCVCELPLIMAALSFFGLVPPTFYSSKRKIAILGIFILAAFLTPTGDPVTQTILAIPLLILFELGIQLSFLAFRHRKTMVG
jgi:sec-independent protein translocase protein TatC